MLGMAPTIYRLFVFITTMSVASCLLSLFDLLTEALLSCEWTSFSRTVSPPVSLAAAVWMILSRLL